MRLTMTEMGEGATVVLVHGFPLDARMWAAQLHGGVPGCRLLAIDLRGRRGSDPGETAWSLEDHARDLAESVEGQMHLVGLSMGGYIALAFARLFPERLASLVLVDTRAAADSPEAAAGRVATAERIRKQGTGFLLDIMLPRLVAPGASDEVRRSIVAQIVDTPPETAARDALAMGTRPDARAWLGEVRAPTLVIHGSADAVVPLDEARAVAALAGGDLAVIPGAGHLAPMESPASFSTVLAGWVARVAGGGPLGRSRG